MEKFILGLFWLGAAGVFWYNGANELINELDSFILAAILGNVWLASCINRK